MNEPARMQLPALHPHAMIGIAGEIVRDMDPYTEAAPAGVLFQFLAGFGAMTGGGPFLMSDSRHPARVWPLIVGPTGTGRKGTSWQAAQAPLWYMDGGSFLDRNVVDGLSTGEGLINRVRDGEEEDPTVPRKRGQQLDPGVSDKRLLVVETEFGRILAAGARDAATLSFVLRRAWDGGRLSVLTRQSPLKASKTHISVIGHITPTELKTKLSEVDRINGFMNRFLIVAVRRTKLLSNACGPPVPMLEAFGARLREKMTRAQRRGRQGVPRSPEAQALWDFFYQGILNPDDDTDGYLTSIISRGAPYAARLSLIYALLDGSDFIEVDHVLAGLACWDYSVSSARNIFDPVKEQNVDADLERAERRIQDAKSLTRSQLSALFRRAKTALELDQLTARLIAGGNVAYGETPERSTHPTLIWIGGDEPMPDFMFSERARTLAAR